MSTVQSRDLLCFFKARFHHFIIPTPPCAYFVLFGGKPGDKRFYLTVQMYMIDRIERGHMKAVLMIMWVGPWTLFLQYLFPNCPHVGQQRNVFLLEVHGIFYVLPGDDLFMHDNKYVLRRVYLVWSLFLI